METDVKRFLVFKGLVMDSGLDLVYLKYNCALGFNTQASVHKVSNDYYHKTGKCIFCKYLDEKGFFFFKTIYETS